MKIVLLFSHKLTENQEKELIENYKCNKIISLPKDLQNKWMAVDDQTDAEIFEKFLLERLNKNDYVLIQGEWGLTYKMINFAFNNEFIPLFSRTTRDVREEKKGDEIIKISVFKHLGFRKYEK